MSVLLVGYDVESFAIGEGLARIGDHGFLEALEPSSTRKALEVIRRNHERYDLPATLFVCGRTLVHSVDVFLPYVEHPLFDIQQHTYSHTLFKEDHWKGGTFIASSREAIEFEIRMTSEAFRKYLGIETYGLRTPHGYYKGLTDKPELLGLLDDTGIRYVSSWARNAEGGNPTPMSVQPFWYADQGYPNLLEIPFQHWLDAVWFEANGVELGREFGEVLKAGVDEAIRDDLVYGACFHDWTMLRYREEETQWVSSMLSHAKVSAAEVLTYSDYYERMRSEIG
jgi:hypothetical protein